jgi:hypothetical protein
MLDIMSSLSPIHHRQIECAAQRRQVSINISIAMLVLLVQT